MPELRPFTALRYSSDAGASSDLVAPPYDVIDDAMAANLRTRSPHNCVRLILPEGDTDHRYTTAAQLLQDWLDEDVLEQDAAPAVYVYRQRFRSGGRDHERRAFFAAARLAPFADGEILPHEETHSGPKRDRLSLTLATGAQLSPAFLIAGEDDDELGRLLRGAEEAGPLLEASTDDGMQHTLWRVEGTGADEICAAASRSSLLIADGHHRYETALEVSRQLSDNVKAKYIMACVVGERDPGLLLATTHRTLAPHPDGALDWVSELGSRFVVSELETPDPEAAALGVAAAAGTGGPASLALHVPEDGRSLLLEPRPEALAASGIDSVSARIASVVFDRLVLRAGYDIGPDEAAEQEILSYQRHAGDAASAAAAAGGVAFLLPPANLSDVRLVAARGERLPPKSTYFEPKVPSGLVFRLL